MGHLGGPLLLLGALTCLRVSGHSRLPACPEPQEFRCSDGSCIPRLNVCDGLPQCEDGSDEHQCGDPLRCKKEEFTCSSRHCVSLHVVCDGVNHCGDGSDESPELCGSSQLHARATPTCTSAEFPCGDGECVPQTWRCDNQMDCSDGSDEENCHQNECLLNNGGCSHHCVDHPKGFICKCPDNMKLVKDNQCEEVDACLESDVCDQLCVHLNGIHTCECHGDYRLNRTTGECTAKGDEAQLVFTSAKGLGRISVSGTEYRELTQHLPGAGSVAALASNRMLYWAPRGQDAIYRVSMDGKAQDSVLVLKVGGSVSGLALDWVHQLLYWTSKENGSVNVGLLDGSAQRQLFTGLDEPSAVAVDPLHGLLFWAQSGSSPQIERATLDGRDRKALVTYSIRQPVALSLDVPRKLLYWLDQGMKTISRINLEGQQRKTVVESNGYLDRAFGLAVFEGFVYWSEEETRSICRTNKHNGRDLQVLLSNATSPGAVVIVQPVLQPHGTSVCGDTGRVCQHKCVVNLLSESPEFSCIRAETGQKKSDSPAVSRTVPASTLSDPSFAGILSLIMFLSLLLMGMALWRWRGQFWPNSPLSEQSFSLKESHDPLIICEPSVDPNTSLAKETLFKLDLDGE